MFDQKKEVISVQNVNPKGTPDVSVNENIEIHTMQDDINALSGIFPKKESLAPSFDSGKTEVKPSSSYNLGSDGKLKKEEKYFNPFLDKQSPNTPNTSNILEKAVEPKEKNNIVSNIPKASTEKEVLSPVNQGNNAPAKPAGLMLNKMIWIIASVVIVIAFSLGGYYFWSSRKTAVVDNSQESTVQPQEETKVEEPKTEENKTIEAIPKYLSDKPNFLPIDTENPSYENFKSIVVQTASEIKNLGITGPIEFVITNKEHSPMSFSVFNALSKIGLSEELLKSLGDNFSLFIYNDLDNVRLGLAVDVTNKIAASASMKSEEPKLATKVASLIFDVTIPPKEKPIFKDSDYKGVTLRYFNFDANKLASVDYAFLNSKMILATSKNSAWVMLEKILNSQK